MLDGLKQRVPALYNLRPFQIAVGAAGALLAHRLWQHHTGAAALDAAGVIVRYFALAVLAVALAVALQNTYRHALIPDYSLKCRYCLGPVNRYSEFCEHCGADLIAPEKLVPCPKCGVELYEGTKHCPECGARTSANVKGGKKKSKRRERQDDENLAPAEVGWSTPVDALTGFPPDDERR